MEGDGELHVVPVQDIGDDGSRSQVVTGVHIDLVDDAGGVGFDLTVPGVVVSGADQAVVIELRGLYGQLGLFHPGAGLFDGVFHVGGINGEEHIVLPDGLSLFKGSGEDLALDQGGGLIGVVGLDGAGAGDGNGHLPLLGCGGQIVAGQDLLSAGHALGKDQSHHGGNDRQDHEPFDPLVFLLWHLELGLPLDRGGSFLRDGLFGHKISSPSDPDNHMMTALQYS